MSLNANLWGSFAGYTIELVDGTICVESWYQDRGFRVGFERLRDTFARTYGVVWPGLWWHPGGRVVAADWAAELPLWLIGVVLAVWYRLLPKRQIAGDVCRHCGYDISHAPLRRCSECGTVCPPKGEVV